MLKYLLFLSASISSYASDGIPYSWHWPESYAEASSWSKIAAYKMASYLTDPPCKAREYSVRSQIVHDLPPSPYIRNSVDVICSYVKYMQLIDESWLDSDKVARFTEKCFLLSGVAMFSTLTPFTALPAMGLRFAASNLESDQFIHYKGLFPEKELEDHTFTHMLWNICGVKGGYDIEEGGQMPIRDDLLSFSENRIYKVTQKILSEDPDVLCLNEVFDINDAIYLVDALKHRYAHFVIHCGARTVGLNSGLFFATKLGVCDISFTPFPKDMLDGMGKYSEKGFLAVKTHDAQGSVGIMVVSHLQHSSQPEYPTPQEELARKKELDLIMQTVNASPSDNLILAGDLNLDDAEFIRANPEFYAQFQKTKDYTSSSSEETKTWLGDAWYIEYGNRDSTFSPLSARNTNCKRSISQGINLDHVLVKIQQEESRTPEITTILKSSGYDPQEISRESLSDHMILLSKIRLKR